MSTRKTTAPTRVTTRATAPPPAAPTSTASADASSVPEKSGKPGTDHLRRCATMMKYSSQHRTRQQFFITWLSSALRTARADARRSYRPPVEVPLPKSADAVSLVRRYFLKWRRHNREKMQRTRANSEALRAANEDRARSRAFIAWQSQTIRRQALRIRHLEDENAQMRDRLADHHQMVEIAETLNQAATQAAATLATGVADTPSPRNKTDVFNAEEHIRSARALVEQLSDSNTKQQMTDLTNNLAASLRQEAENRSEHLSQRREIEDLRAAAIRAIDALGGSGATNDEFFSSRAETTQESVARSQAIADTLRDLSEDMIVVLVLTSIWSGEGAAEKVSEVLERTWRRVTLLESEKADAEAWLDEMNCSVARCGEALESLLAPQAPPPAEKAEGDANTSSNGATTAADAQPASIATLASDCRKNVKTLAAVGYEAPQNLVTITQKLWRHYNALNERAQGQQGELELMRQEALLALRVLRPMANQARLQETKKLAQSLHETTEELLAAHAAISAEGVATAKVLGDLRAKVDKKEKELENLQQQSRVLDERGDNLVKQNKSLERNIADLQEEIRRFQADHKELNAENEKLAAELAALQSESQAAKESQQTLTLHSTELQDALLQAQQQNEALQSENAELRAALTESVGALGGQQREDSDLLASSRQSVRELSEALAEAGETVGGTPSGTIRRQANELAEMKKRAADLRAKLREGAAKEEELQHRVELLECVLRGVEAQLLMVTADEDAPEAESLANAAQEAALELTDSGVTQPMSLFANLSVLVSEAKEVVRSIPPNDGDASPRVFAMADLFPIVSQATAALASRLEACDAERQMCATIAIFLRDLVRDGIGRVLVVNDSILQQRKLGDEGMSSMVLNSRSLGPLQSSSDPSDYVAFILSSQNASEADTAAVQEHMSQNITIGKQSDPSTWDVVAEFHDQLVTLCARAFEVSESAAHLTGENEQLRSVLEGVYHRLSVANGEVKRAAGIDAAAEGAGGEAGRPPLHSSLDSTIDNPLLELDSDFVEVDDVEKQIAETEELYHYVQKCIELLSPDAVEAAQRPQQPIPNTLPTPGLAAGAAKEEDPPSSDRQLRGTNGTGISALSPDSTLGMTAKTAVPAMSLGQTLYGMCVSASEFLKEAKAALDSDLVSLDGEAVSDPRELVPMLKNRIEELVQARKDSEAFVKSLDNVWNDQTEDVLGSSMSSVVMLKSLKPKKKPLPALESYSKEIFEMQHTLRHSNSNFAAGTSGEARIKAMRQNARNKIDEVQALAATCRTAVALLEGRYKEGEKLPHYEALNTAMAAQVEQLKQGLERCADALGSTKEGMTVGELLESLSNSVVSLELERNSLREQLGSKTKQNIMLLDDLDAANEKAEEKAEELEQALAGKHQLADDKAALEAQLAQLTEQLRAGAGNVSLTEGDAEKLRADLRFLRIQLACLREEARVDLTGMAAEFLDPIRAALALARQKEETLRCGATDDLARLPELEQRVEAQEQTIADLEEEVMDLHRQMRETEVQRVFLEADVMGERQAREEDASRQKQQLALLPPPPPPPGERDAAALQHATALVMDAMQTLSSEKLAHLFGSIAEDAVMVHQLLHETIYDIIEGWESCANCIDRPQLRVFDEIIRRSTSELVSLSLLSDSMAAKIPEVFKQ